jgi:hypothetical protein
LEVRVYLGWREFLLKGVRLVPLATLFPSHQ